MPRHRSSPFIWDRVGRNTRRSANWDSNTVLVNPCCSFSSATAPSPTVIAALAPVCADKFRALPDADAKKVALSKVDSWKRRDEFPKELVTLPGES